LVLQSRVDESTLYHPPALTNLEPISLELQQDSIAVGESLLRTVTIKNHGPGLMDGKVNLQFYISEQSLGSSEDPRSLGYQDH